VVSETSIGGTAEAGTPSIALAGAGTSSKLGTEAIGALLLPKKPLDSVGAAEIVTDAKTGAEDGEVDGNAVPAILLNRLRILPIVTVAGADAATEEIVTETGALIPSSSSPAISDVAAAEGDKTEASIETSGVTSDIAGVEAEVDGEASVGCVLKRPPISDILAINLRNLPTRIAGTLAVTA